MKKIESLIIFLIFIIIITGCVNKDDSSMELVLQTSNQKTLSMRITWKTYSGRGEAIKNIVDSYNNSNETNYWVELIDGDENLDDIERQLTKNEVDIYVLPYRYIQYFGHQNKLDDLTDSFQQDKGIFYENIWKLGTVDEHVYGIPWVGHSMGLIYNKDLLEKAGVDPSKINSLDALLKACKQVEEKTEAKGIGLVGADHNDISWMINQFIYGFGGALVNDEGNKVTINSESAKAAIQFYKNDLGQYAQNTWTDDSGVEVMEYFRKGQVAFEIQSLWGVTEIWKNGRPFEIGVIPLDHIGLYSEVGPLMLALQPELTNEEREAAIDFIQYLISTQAQEMIMDGEKIPEHDAYYPFRLPVRKDIAETIVSEKYPEFLVFLDGFNKPSIDVPVPNWQIIKDELYAPGLHLVMLNELDVDDFLDHIKEQGDIILNTN